MCVVYSESHDDFFFFYDDYLSSMFFFLIFFSSPSQHNSMDSVNDVLHERLSVSHLSFRLDSMSELYGHNV